MMVVIGGQQPTDALLAHLMRAEAIIHQQVRDAEVLVEERVNALAQVRERIERERRRSGYGSSRFLPALIEPQTFGQ